jgi:hypothetical protein
MTAGRGRFFLYKFKLEQNCSATSFALVIPDTCGVINTWSIFQRALLSGKGSTSNTSKMTADNHLLFIALINESSDIMLLLPILINTLCLSTTQFEEKLY